MCCWLCVIVIMFPLEEAGCKGNICTWCVYSNWFCEESFLKMCNCNGLRSGMMFQWLELAHIIITHLCVALVAVCLCWFHTVLRWQKRFVVSHLCTERQLPSSLSTLCSRFSSTLSTVLLTRYKFHSYGRPRTTYCRLKSKYIWHQSVTRQQISVEPST